MKRYYLVLLFVTVTCFSIFSISSINAADNNQHHEAANMTLKAGKIGDKIDCPSVDTNGYFRLEPKKTPNYIKRELQPTVTLDQGRVLLFNNETRFKQNKIPTKSGNRLPKRDDPFDDWISYDDGEPVWLRNPENTWSRVTFTTETEFTLQGISIMPHNPGNNDNEPCTIIVYSEDQNTHDLQNILWETEIESLDDWNTDDIDENWQFVEIPEDDWIVFEEGVHFSILYGPAPGGTYTGLNRWDIVDDFENYDLDEPPSGDEWSYVEDGRSWVAVTDDEAYSEDQSVQFHDSRDEEGDYCLLQYESDEIEAGMIEFWLWLSDDGSFGFRAYSGDDLEFLIQFEDDNRIITNNGDEYVYADGRYPDEEWFSIRILFDSDDGTFTAWMDDEEIIDGNDLFTGGSVNMFWWLCFNNTIMDDAYLDDFKINYDLDVPYGWWNLFDDETDTDRSFVFEGEDIDTDHNEWEVLDGDLLIRANGEYPEQEPDIHLSRDAIDFGNVFVDQQRDRTFTITNRGREDLIVSDISVEGEYFDTDFNREFTLEPDDDRDITVTFAPEEEGDFNGSVTIESNDPDEREVTIDLSGSGGADDVERQGVELLGRIEDWDDVNDVAIQDEFAFLAAGVDGLIIVDCSDPGNLEVIGSYNTSGDAKGVTVVGDYAYVADFRDGLRIIDVTDPENPDEVGYFDTPGRAHSVVIWGDYAYVADGPSGVRKIDITDPENPTELDRNGFIDTPGDARDIDIGDDNYGYIADYGNGVVWFRLSTMSEVNSVETHHLAYGLVKRGDHIYLADGNAGILVFNSDLWDEEVCSFNTEGTAFGLGVSGNYVYIADGEDGLRVIDMSDFENPVELGYYDTPGEARRLANDGNVIYLADGNNLSIYDCERAINNQAPEWTETPNNRLSVDECDLVEFNLQAEDPNDDELTLIMNSDNLPDDAEFTDNENGTGDFRWQTSDEDAGEYFATFVVSDGDLTDTFNMTIVVDDANEAPEWTETPEDTLEVDEGQSIEFHVIAEDPNDDDLTIEIDRGEIPDRARFIDLGNGTGSFTWHTNLEDAGIYHPAFIVSDGDLMAVFEPTIIINNVSSIEDELALPTSFSVLGVYPNPFNSTTTITYGLAEAAPTRLALYDLSGREIITLFEGYKQAGYHTATLTSGDLSSGLYFLRLDAGGFSQSRKLVLVR